MLLSLRLFGLMIGLLPLVCLAQQIQVKSGDNPLDGESFVQLFVAASEPYALSSGRSFTPLLQVQCKQKGNTRKLDVYLVTGGIDPSSTYVTKSLFTTAAYSTDLRAKIDGGKPATRVWAVLNDNSTLAYTTSNGKTKNGFVKDLLGAKIVYIEFRPYAATGNVAAQFDVSGLQAEFAKQQQCK